MRDFNVGSYLRIVWWLWLCIILLTLIGSLMWFLRERTEEPVLEVLGIFAFLLVEGLGFFKALEDRQEQLKILNHVSGEAERTRDLVLSEHEKTRSLIKTHKQKISVSIDGYVSKEHREADLRRLKKLWKHIPSRQLDDVLSFFLNAEQIEYDSYKNLLPTYIDLRRLPENRFTNATLESNFTEFDKHANDFEALRLENTGRERNILYAHRVFLKRKEDRWDFEEYERRENYKLEQWQKLWEKYSTLIKVHTELVDSIKHTLPEFEFD